ncbi:MAG: hypothetical protein WBP61_01190 [Nocardioides sp.]
MQDWIMLAAVGLLALVALALAVALRHARRRTERELAASRAETADLQLQLEALARRVDRSRPVAGRESDYVITDLGGDTGAEPQPSEVAPSVGAALFADLVLRESVVKAAGLAHGVRRALDAESRNRIRFEMRREIRRARKQRRLDTRQARREWEARRRADLPDGAGDTLRSGAA